MRTAWGVMECIKYFCASCKGHRFAALVFGGSRNQENFGFRPENRSVKRRIDVWGKLRLKRIQLRTAIGGHIEHPIALIITKIFLITLL
ncbi:MAG: hypothetical protein PHH11_05220 [Methylomonas sp.]|nr:hypothetical protein [Methylomonas sp.]